MTNMLIKGLVATAVLAALTGCGSDDDNTAVVAPTTCAEAGADCKIFTVLHTNDNHGRFWSNSDGEYGMAARKTLIDQIRAEVSSNGGETLLLSGGDINTGVPESDLQDALPDFIGMNEIAYDAMAVGNHEFDNPLAVLDSQRSVANFPMLAANIYKADGTRYFDAYKVFDVNGVRVAVIGLTTEDTAKIGNPEFIKDLTFTDPTTEAAKVIAEIKAADTADLIFATTHMGHYADAQNGSNAPGDVTLARALAAGDLSAIIGGHSQNPVCMEPDTNDYAEFAPGDACTPDMQNGTYIMQAHEWGKYVGRADFEYFNGELHLASYKLIPVNLKKTVEDAEGNKTKVLVADEITADADLKALLSYYQERGQGQLDEIIATTDALLDGERANVRNMQTNLGRLVAEAQRTKVGADIGVMNSGGVRASIQAGDISYRDVLTVQPFGNMVTLSTMTGAEVTEYLNTVASFQRGSGAYAQITGVKMTVDCTAQTVAISEINGKDYSATDSYSFTVPSFNAAGGDGYPTLDPIQTGYVDAEVLYTFFKDKGTIAAADYAPIGDIVYENSNSPLGCEVTAN
ncbi:MULTISPECIES: bifunctional UDP-sugar hydrolase/5'-nucleotidase UshA [unclassified Shewanella]|jgi:5'-nucleotidase/UDP-sugar diphosphatase|uniref:bifunctional UDP-sugar hydrolase/5'-nucleotidase UshA n=1 Tax=unclassified Shewanella TaxID=196818 RepID=UPI000C339F33|nr:MULTISPECIES: bifunctional UDP-sugar hydrolase/5'-nucleotidase UshA [unclassified Shewanella]MBB1361994.1 bifunctional UDP-sugar hydrolase/5'-nucleotidase [Shewanella sp. SR44-4]MBO1895212.1 bifunctional UDP-sugar hydrolase/5'-nucleotidase [Shewanella sp. BF02_Schw]PKH32425.1 bifunctional UDP-sugar hydrolase/5'-nucleotidase [Shewanella sp. ALD9]QHS13833.1 bifunctional UDP-sugar hydrolase/5'-nucleotidase [Shewanella sp. Arc9-LZ]